MLQEERVIIIAPVGQDAATMAALLNAEDFASEVCQRADECACQITAGVGALLLTEEALELPRASDLLEALKAQPPWSELPLIILTSGGESRRAKLLDVAAAAAGTVTLLERPLSERTLVRSVQVALRSRRRQYQVRDLLEKQQRDQGALRQHAQHQQTLYGLVHALTRAESVQDVIEAALDAITDALRCERAAILLRDDGGVMRFTASLGLSSAYRANVEGHSPWPPGEADPQPVSFANAAIAPFEPTIRLAIQQEGIGALAFLPLLSQGRLLGKFVAYYNAPHFFSAEEMQLAQVIARHLAFGIERKRADAALAKAQGELKEHAGNLEQTVAERTARLRETVQDLEAFSYSIAHDMRAPLRAMQGFSKILHEEYSEQIPGEGKDYLRRIAASANRLDHLIQDVLNYSKIVRVELNLAPLETEKFIHEIIESYPNLHPPHAEIEVAGPVPPVLANPAAFTQVVSNLLGNAVKFVKAGVKPRVLVGAELIPDDMVRISFEDNGIGIRKEAQDRIFMMFQRLNPPGDYEGTGIGLAIVRKAVERMGGRVGVESEPGKGSRFWIDLKRQLTDGSG
jgi:signal transduction histidine kinase/FixJ family two-component response regulator